MLDIVFPVLLLALLFHVLRIAPAWLAKPGSLFFGNSYGSDRRAAAIHAPYRLAPRAEWQLERHGLTLQASTTALNALPKRIASSLGPNARSLARRFYDAGIVFGVAGTLGGVAGAVWAWARVWLAVWDEAEAHAHVVVPAGGVPVPKVLRRAVTAIAQVQVPAVHSANAGLQPLIPGVTTPLSHLPTLVLAVILCQLVHELGHAVAAALDDVTPSKLAFSLHFILPSASVVFPSSVDFLSGRTRARIAMSGPWHNLLLWVGLLALSGVGRGILYADRVSEGRIVVGVAKHGALAQHLHTGDMITHIDDVFIGGREDIWAQYLTGKDTGGHTGWCLNKWEFADAPLAPCSQRNTIGFQLNTMAGDVRCLEPHSILAHPATDCHCAVSQVCIRPAPSERILRIRYRRGAKWDTLLWSGDRSTVLEQVEVGTQTPRLWGAATRWMSLFMTYLKLASLSLYLLNLLPLPQTDGIHLFSALLASHRSRPARQLSTQPSSRHPTINPYRYDDSDDSDEDGEPEPSWATGNGRREEVWQRRLRRIVEGSTSALVAAWVLGWAMLGLLRSS